MDLLRKIQYSQFWNIGFCEQTPEDLVRDKRLKEVRWLKHSYRDRWFADPFILKVTNEEIIVFVEECPVENPKGIICELVIDRRTMRLKERYVLLELDTHLSYPAIIRHKGKVYVYPENGASGKLNIYEYNSEKHLLVNPVCILNEAVADATIVEQNGCCYMSATKFPKTQRGAYLFVSESLFGPFRQVEAEPYQTNKACSRQGGNWFEAYGSIYRPAQNCKVRYGGGLSIMYSDLRGAISEKQICQLGAVKGRYSLGLHTLNFNDGLCVIDGYGYYYPVLGELYYALRKLIGKKD